MSSESSCEDLIKQIKLAFTERRLATVAPVPDKNSVESMEINENIVQEPQPGPSGFTKRFPSAVASIPDMYSLQSVEIIDDFVQEPQPGPSTSTTEQFVMPARRPTAVKMISNKRKVSIRVTQRFSPYLIKHLRQSGVIDRLENEAVELPYNGNMARIKPQKIQNVLSDSERAQRDRNNVASRQSRLKAKLLEGELQAESVKVEEENRRQKIKIAMYRTYIQSLLKKSGAELMNFDGEWVKEANKDIVL